MKKLIAIMLIVSLTGAVIASPQISQNTNTSQASKDNKGKGHHHHGHHHKRADKK